MQERMAGKAQSLSLSLPKALLLNSFNFSKLVFPPLMTTTDLCPLLAVVLLQDVRPPRVGRPGGSASRGLRVAPLQPGLVASSSWHFSSFDS